MVGRFLVPRQMAIACHSHRRYLLQFIDHLGGWGSSDGMDQVELPVEGYVAGARRDPIVARLEERIANHTGIPVHPHEDILSIFRVSSHGGLGDLNIAGTHWTMVDSWDLAPDSPRGGFFPPFGLHHDSHERPHRAWTLMVYLQLPDSGGRRIFPLAGRPPKDGEPAERHRQFMAALQDLFGGAERNFSRRAFFDVHAEHPFMDLIEESCRGEYGVSFLPMEPGAAILYPSHSRSLRTWTAGCNVIKGTQIVLQKFKEYPLERRGQDEPIPPYQPFVEQ
ncbi:unnamed protein product [Cladocopium goreaui]|uniref:Prolyl 4-hydroxylase 7 n=1 Tax=Cladocopium goreaui TaxID=2562237 RepID=A0A9P1CXU9_9DINO|nr:unnamed protein product [Cladocopium goreaui]